MRGDPMKFMKHIPRRLARCLLKLMAVIVAGALLGGLVGEFFMGGWGEGMIFGGIVGAFLGMLYDPRAAHLHRPPSPPVGARSTPGTGTTARLSTVRGLPARSSAVVSRQ
jgi:hypothetical protein